MATGQPPTEKKPSVFDELAYLQNPTPFGDGNRAEVAKAYAQVFASLAAEQPAGLAFNKLGGADWDQFVQEVAARILQKTGKTIAPRTADPRIAAGEALAKEMEAVILMYDAERLTAMTDKTGKKPSSTAREKHAKALMEARKAGLSKETTPLS